MRVAEIFIEKQGEHGQISSLPQSQFKTKKSKTYPPGAQTHYWHLCSIVKCNSRYHLSSFEVTFSTQSEHSLFECTDSYYYILSLVVGGDRLLHNHNISEIGRLSMGPAFLTHSAEIFCQVYIKFFKGQFYNFHNLDNVENLKVMSLFSLSIILKSCKQNYCVTETDI